MSLRSAVELLVFYRRSVAVFSFCYRLSFYFALVCVSACNKPIEFGDAERTSAGTQNGKNQTIALLLRVKVTPEVGEALGVGDVFYAKEIMTSSGVDDSGVVFDSHVFEVNGRSIVVRANDIIEMRPAD